MPKLVNKELKKEEILFAGIKTFSEKGFHQSTIEDISKKAKIGKGTVYEYFKSKEDIVLFSLNLYSNRTIKNLIEIKNSDFSFEKKIHQTIELHKKDMEEYADMNPVYFELLSRKNSSFGKKFKNKLHKIYTEITLIIKQILEKERIMNSELHSILFTASLDGICQSNLLFEFNQKKLNQVYLLFEKNFINSIQRKKS